MKRYKPMVDRLFWIVLISTGLLVAAMTVLSAFQPMTLVITLPIDLIVAYLLVSPLFGYVELREDGIFIKYGLILKREIPYSKIRGAVKGKNFYSNSMLSLKNSFEHVDIKYNAYDVTTVSVVDNDGFIKDIEARIAKI